MKFVEYLALGEIVEAVKDNKNTIATVLTNPVGATAVVAVTLGAMYFANERRKQDLERKNNK